MNGPHLQQVQCNDDPVPRVWVWSYPIADAQRIKIFEIIPSLRAQGFAFGIVLESAQLLRFLSVSFTRSHPEVDGDVNVTFREEAVSLCVDFQEYECRAGTIHSGTRKTPFHEWVTLD